MFETLTSVPDRVLKRLRSRAADHVDIHTALRELVLQIDRRIAGPTPEFFKALDTARLDFLRNYKTASLDTKLALVKVLNLLVNKHEYLQRKVAKVGRASGFMLDPANACQLGCPSCQHSFNKAFTASAYQPMPKGVMRPDSFQRLIDSLGPFAFVGHFYNNSEPFLNKRIYDYLGEANRYRINTFISSNLSLPKLDAEAIVHSGLNTLMAAIDGTTQEVYEKYRRGGHLELALDNAVRITEAKQRLKSKTPHLRWQFLTFGHNVHQVEDAIELARKIGFDSLNIATPYDVSYDDPSITVAQHPRVARGETDVYFRAPPPMEWLRSLDPIADRIDASISESFFHRYERIGGRANSEAPTNEDYGYCDWLHLAVISDALGRILPCCIPDYAQHGSFVFANLEADSPDLLNSSRYQQARLLFADQWAYRAPLASADRYARSKCDGCLKRPRPQVGLGAIASYLLSAADVYGQWLNEDLLNRLTGWSRHTETAVVRPLIHDRLVSLISRLKGYRKTVSVESNATPVRAD